MGNIEGWAISENALAELRELINERDSWRDLAERTKWRAEHAEQQLKGAVSLEKIGARFAREAVIPGTPVAYADLCLEMQAEVRRTLDTLRGQ